MLWLIGTPTRARTVDTLIKSQVLYQLSYGCAMRAFARHVLYDNKSF